MPDGFFPPRRPPDAPVYLAPRPARPELLVDQEGVFLADPENNLIGFDTDWGRGGVLAKLLYAGRAATRDF